ncbi:MAG: hypothetical protein M1817_005557 [Caeruleum heppii]|nr:MAG: hypothetical protein M1817_005557 [Caeruleum heppii]
MAGTGDTRAEALLDQALELLRQGKLEEGHRKLREAASLSPDNEKVKDALTNLKEDQGIHPLARLCRRLVQDGDEAAGDEASQHLRSSGVSIPSSTAAECVDILFQPSEKILPITDEILAGLVRLSRDARAHLASRLEESTTNELFETVWMIGDRSFDSLIIILLDKAIWTSSAIRENCETDIFLLLTAKLMEAAQDGLGRALRGIARLMASDSELLHAQMDVEGFEIILTSLDMRSPSEVRSQATLATAKYLEASKEKGQKHLQDFMSSKVAKGTPNDLVLAFSAAAAVFPIVPSIAASMFLSNGFVEDLGKSLGKRAAKPEVAKAVLELFSAACIDRACREAISKYCADWLQWQVKKGREDNQGTAAVVLAKIQGTQDEEKAKKDDSQRVQEERDGPTSTELVDRFKSMLIQKNSRVTQQTAIEGLAYTSLQPSIKAALGTDKVFLRQMIDLLKSCSITPSSNPTLFGGLTVLLNLTAYLPPMSEEQKKMAQLKAYAATKKPRKLEPDEAEKDPAVTLRCHAVLDAGAVPLFVSAMSTVTPTAQSLILRILLDLAKEQKHRGVMAQQGALKLLLHVLNKKSSTLDQGSLQAAAHALARILISVNPELVFNPSSLPSSLAVRPLISLLPSSSPETPTSTPPPPPPTLATFESLLALTNLSSLPPSTTPAPLITTLTTLLIPDLPLSSNPHLQRATLELLTNLCLHPSGIALLADPSSPTSKRILHIVVALADAEEVSVRRAAAGALAMLTEWDVGVEAVLNREGSVKILMGLCGADEADDGVLHRGVVALGNVVGAEGEVGKRGREMVRDGGGVEVLRSLEKSSGVGKEVKSAARGAVGVMEEDG